jgi:hypothetical protein
MNHIEVWFQQPEKPCLMELMDSGMDWVNRQVGQSEDTDILYVACSKTLPASSGHYGDTVSSLCQLLRKVVNIVADSTYHRRKLGCNHADIQTSSPPRKESF